MYEFAYHKPGSLADAAAALNSAADGKLMAGATGQETYRVFARSETEWFYKVVEATLVFEVDDSGVCNQLVLHQNGRKLTGKRVE